MNKALYVGCPGFPKGLAQVQRQLLVSKGLIENGCDVMVLNRYGVHNKNQEKEVEVTGFYEGVEYHYCSGTPFRSDKFVLRNLMKIVGFIKEFTSIIKQRYKYGAKTMIITSTSFGNLVYYTTLAKIINCTSVMDKVEYQSSVELATLKAIGAKLDDRYYGFFADKAIVISDFLMGKLKESSPKAPALKIPAICDFSKFLTETKQEDEKQYFLFCASANYQEVIKFVIDAYAMLDTSIGLTLVVSGEKRKIEEVKEYLTKKGIKNARIKSGIPYDYLVSLYKNSLALLIPLRPNIKDIARFPHKLGEYTASKRPIVSTNVGEVPNYFVDGKNAFISEDYDVTNFSKKMQEVIDFPDQREKIAVESYATGEMEFDYKKNMTKLHKFLFSNNQ